MFPSSDRRLSRAARRSELIWLGFHPGPSCGIDAVRSRLAESAGLGPAVVEEVLAVFRHRDFDAVRDAYAQLARQLGHRPPACGRLQ